MRHWMWMFLMVVLGCGNEPPGEVDLPQAVVRQFPGGSPFFGVRPKITLGNTHYTLGRTAILEVTGHSGAWFTTGGTTAWVTPETGIDVTSVEVLGPSRLNVRVVFHDWGTTGVKMLHVGGCSVWLGGGTCTTYFMVEANPNPPTVVLHPDWVVQGSTSVRTVRGTHTQFTLGTTTVTTETAGLVFEVFDLLRFQQLRVRVTAHASLAPGVYSFTVHTEGEHVTGHVEVVPPASVLQVVPSEIVQDVPQWVEVTGAHTHFAAGFTTATVSGGDVTVLQTEVVSPEVVRLRLGAAKTAVPGVRELTLITQTERVTGALTVLRHAPVIESVTPSGCRQGESCAVVLEVDYLNCPTDLRFVRLEHCGIRVDGCAGAHRVHATVTCPELSPVGPAVLTLETHWGHAVTVGFTVEPGIPRVDLQPTGVWQYSSGVPVRAVARHFSWLEPETPTTDCPQVHLHSPELVNAKWLQVLVDVPVTQQAQECTLTFSNGLQAVLTIRQRVVDMAIGETVTRELTPTVPVFVRLHLTAGVPVRIRATAGAFTQIDPVLQLADATADFAHALADNDDEHEATLDAMILYVPPASGVYFARVTDRLGLIGGDVTISVSDFSVPLGDFVEFGMFGDLGEPVETTWTIPATWFGVHVGVVAQGIMPVSGADVLLEVYDADTHEWLASGSDSGAWPDPRVFVWEEVLSLQLQVTHLDGGDHFWLYGSPARQISEVFHDETTGWTEGFVELWGPPSGSLSGCELELDAEGQFLQTVNLDGRSFDTYGWFVVAGYDWVPGVNLVVPGWGVDDPLGLVDQVTLRLVCHGHEQSRVCYCPTTEPCPSDCVRSAPGSALGQGLGWNRLFLEQPEATPGSFNPKKVP